MKFQKRFNIGFSYNEYYIFISNGFREDQKQLAQDRTKIINDMSKGAKKLRTKYARIFT